MEVDLTELEGRRFRCLPGCGFCCTVSPALVEREPVALGANPRVSPFIVREAGRVGLALSDGACACLGADRACAIYNDRPLACRLFPLHVHLGERVQVSANAGCPGVGDEGEPLAHVARRALDAALTPAARREAERARLNFREFHRRCERMGAPASRDELIAAFVPLASALARPGAVGALYAIIADGRLGIEDVPTSLSDKAAPWEEIARETFVPDPSGRPTRVDPATLAWGDARVEADRVLSDGRPDVALADLPLPVDSGAADVLPRYFETLVRREHALGHAARIVDATGYEATLPAAFGRMLADAAAATHLRSGLVARWRGAARVAAPDAEAGIRWHDMAFLSQPTIGAVL